MYGVYAHNYAYAYVCLYIFKQLHNFIVSYFVFVCVSNITFIYLQHILSNNKIF